MPFKAHRATWSSPTSLSCLPTHCASDPWALFCPVNIGGFFPSGLWITVLFVWMPWTLLFHSWWLPITQLKCCLSLSNTFLDRKWRNALSPPLIPPLLSQHITLFHYLCCICNYQSHTVHLSLVHNLVLHASLLPPQLECKFCDNKNQDMACLGHTVGIYWIKH